MYGIDVKNSEPEVFYTPKLISNLKDVVLYDPNYLSNVGKISEDDISDFFKKHSVIVDYKMALRERFLDIPCQKELFAGSIYEFIDILYLSLIHISEPTRPY